MNRRRGNKNRRTRKNILNSIRNNKILCRLETHDRFVVSLGYGGFRRLDESSSEFGSCGNVGI